MKKKIFYLVTLLTFVLTSSSKADTQAEKRKKIVDKIIAQENDCLQRVLANCPDWCSLNCPDSISECHVIDSLDFQVLIKNWTNNIGIARQRIEEITRDRDCMNEALRIWREKITGFHYRIERRNAHPGNVYYSIPTLRGILQKYPDAEKFMFYKSYSNAQRRYVIPFKVIMRDGSEKYYDISDANP